LTDFGLSKKLKPYGKAEIKNGSPLYIAPEVVDCEPCGLELDLWSLGILAYEMTNLITPFGTQVINKRDSFHKAIFAFQSVRAWHKRDVSPQLKDLVHGLLRDIPHERLGAKGWRFIKEHPFFKADDFSWTAL
jgi:serine/threonine protein kinase